MTSPPNQIKEKSIFLLDIQNKSSAGVLRHFAKLTGKNLCLRPATLLKKRLWCRCFPVNFAKFLRTPFSQNTSGGPLLDITPTK